MCYDNSANLNIAFGGLDKVKNVTPWRYFINVYEKDFSGIEELIDDHHYIAVEVYNLDGIKISNSTENLPDGIYIIRQNSIFKKIRIR